MSQFGYINDRCRMSQLGYELLRASTPRTKYYTARPDRAAPVCQMNRIAIVAIERFILLQTCGGRITTLETIGSLPHALGGTLESLGSGRILLGKFLGLLAVMLCVVVGMGLVSSGFVTYAGGKIDARHALLNGISRSGDRFRLVLSRRRILLKAQVQI